MTTRVVLATGNAKKLAEMRRIVAEQDVDVEVLGLADFPPYPEPVEDGHTFEDNALIKARAAAQRTGLPALADDSGIEVDVLNDMPGVRSARWAGTGASDEDNLRLLLRQIDDVPDGRRGGRFACAIALALPDGQAQVLRCDMPGHVVRAPRGENGFGYDPIFVADGHTLTNAELSPAEKDAISHRGQAIRAVVPWLRQLTREGSVA